MQAQWRAKHEAEKAERIRSRVELVEIDVDEFTPEEEKIALAKVQRVAEHFDPVRQGHLDDFVNGPPMKPTVFREQLRRNFGLFLTKAELGAIFKHFDVDGGGTIDGSEFLSQFFRQGRQKRESTVKAKRELDAKVRYSSWPEIFPISSRCFLG